MLGFMVVSLYAGFSSGFAVLRVARENLRATQVLEERMEVVRLIRWNDVVADGFIPATFGTQAAAKFTAKSGIYLKQTTLDTFLRNPKNKADEFEAGVLKKFADPSYPRQGEKIVSEQVDGGKTTRVMLPLFYGKGCLNCHGEPKGEKDISGYMKEGAKEGDLGGAISVKLAQK